MNSTPAKTALKYVPSNSGFELELSGIWEATNNQYNDVDHLVDYSCTGSVSQNVASCTPQLCGPPNQL